jgi:hypothetical protein
MIAAADWCNSVLVELQEGKSPIQQLGQLHTAGKRLDQTTDSLSRWGTANRSKH